MTKREKIGLKMILVGIWLMIMVLSFNMEVSRLYLFIELMGSLTVYVGWFIFGKEKWPCEKHKSRF